MITDTTRISDTDTTLLVNQDLSTHFLNSRALDLWVPLVRSFGQIGSGMFQLMRDPVSFFVLVGHDE